jgi:hypothetical protein
MSESRLVRRSKKMSLAAGLSIPLLLLSGCGGKSDSNGFRPTDAERLSRSNPSSLKHLAETSLAAKSFTVTVSTTGGIQYQATMHYNAPDRIDVLTASAGIPVESISIGATNYESENNSHRFITGTARSPFADTVLKVLKNLETAQVSSQIGGRFAVTEPGPPSVAAEVTTTGGFVSGITLHYPRNTTTYSFSDFNSTPPVTAPATDEIEGSGQTFPDGSPVPKCNRDGSIPAGTDVCIG